MGVRKQTKYLTMSAMLCALSVIILAVGSLVTTLDYTLSIVASLLCTYAVIEMGGAYPWMIWLGTSFLGFLLLPQKSPALFYALLAGFYPILKEKIETRRRPLAWALKLAVFHISLAATALCLWVFFPGSLVAYGNKWMLAVLYLLAITTLVLYDIALSRMITFYLFKLRHRFHIK